MGLSFNRSVIKAAETATNKFGVGAGSSRLVTGNNYLYSLLETKIKKLKKTSACCVFGSGFLANIGVISSLINKKDRVLIDQNIGVQFEEEKSEHYILGLHGQLDLFKEDIN